MASAYKFSISYPPMPGPISLAQPYLANSPAKNFTIPSPLLALGVNVVHELVDERDGNLLDLTLGVGDLARRVCRGRCLYGVWCQRIQHRFLLRSELVQRNIVLDVLRHQALRYLERYRSDSRSMENTGLVARSGEAD